MSISRGKKAAIVAVSIVLVAIAAYSVFPYVASTSIKDLKPGQTAYLYGTVQSRFSIGNVSGFKLNESSGSIVVIWNGTLPGDGTKVLVHGTYNQFSIVFLGADYFEADSVINWPV